MHSLTANSIDSLNFCHECTVAVEYWQEFFNKLGVQIETTSVSNAAQQQQYRFYVAVIRWLSLPETKKLDPVLARTKFVLALLHAGPALLAQNVAEHLNIDLQSELFYFKQLLVFKDTLYELETIISFQRDFICELMLLLI